MKHEVALLQKKIFKYSYLTFTTAHCCQTVGKLFAYYFKEVKYM